MNNNLSFTNPFLDGLSLPTVHSEEQSDSRSQQHARPIQHQPRPNRSSPYTTPVTPVYAPRENQVYPAPTYDSNNSYDNFMKILYDNRNVMKSADELKILTSTMLDNVDYYKLGHDALQSTTFKIPYIGPMVSSLCCLLGKINERNNSVPNSPNEKPHDQILIDGYIISVEASTLSSEECIIIPPYPYRPMNIKAAVICMISSRPKTGERALLTELNLLMRIILQMMFENSEQVKSVYYNSGTNIVKGTKEAGSRFPECVAVDLKRTISTFIQVNPTREDQGIRVPDLESYHWFSRIAKAIQVTLQGARRTQSRLSLYSEELYIRTLQFDNRCPSLDVIRRRNREPLMEGIAPVEDNVAEDRHEDDNYTD